MSLPLPITVSVHAFQSIASSVIAPMSPARSPYRNDDQDRAIPQPVRCPVTRCRYDATNVGALDELGELSEPPPCDHRDGTVESARHRPVAMRNRRNERTDAHSFLVYHRPRPSGSQQVRAKCGGGGAARIAKRLHHGLHVSGVVRDRARCCRTMRRTQPGAKLLDDGAQLHPGRRRDASRAQVLWTQQRWQRLARRPWHELCASDLEPDYLRSRR